MNTIRGISGRVVQNTSQSHSETQITGVKVMTYPSPFVLSPPTKPGPMLHALFNHSLQGIPAEHEGPAFSSLLSHVEHTK